MIAYDSAELAAIRAELTQIADAIGQLEYSADLRRFTSDWANIGRHVPGLLSTVDAAQTEIGRLRAELDDARADLVTESRRIRDAAGYERDALAARLAAAAEKVLEEIETLRVDEQTNTVVSIMRLTALYAAVDAYRAIQ